MADNGKTEVDALNPLQTMYHMHSQLMYYGRFDVLPKMREAFVHMEKICEISFLKEKVKVKDKSILNNVFELEKLLDEINKVLKECTKRDSNSSF